MCTIGYHKKLNLLFKNRDKTDNTIENIFINSKYMSIKTEGSNYFSLGINKKGCSFVSAAVNTPLWTSLIAEGKIKEASVQFNLENKGLTNPIIMVSKYFPEVEDIDQWLEKIVNKDYNYMGYNIILADKSKAVHIELYSGKYHITPINDCILITNHFQTIHHGPQQKKDYPSSFERFNSGKKQISTVVCIEDFFNFLKPNNNASIFWREGKFKTISSSVIDLDSDTIYYAPDKNQGFTRLSGTVPLKGTEKKYIEMSRYIDLPTYHKIERGHPFYEEMIEEVNNELINYYNKAKIGEDKLQILELGAGTGLCTLELIKNKFLHLDCLEIDEHCCSILSNHQENKFYNVINDDAVHYCKNNHYDVIVSTFAHDHIPYSKRFHFAENIFNNLKKGGIYIMGGEILPYFSNDLERKKSLFLYHNYIIKLALQQNRVQLSELENNALKSGLDMIGDFKRHETMFEKEMISAGFKMIQKKKMGPLDRDDVGGVFVYIFEA